MANSVKSTSFVLWHGGQAAVFRPPGGFSEARGNQLAPSHDPPRPKHTHVQIRMRAHTNTRIDGLTWTYSHAPHNYLTIKTWTRK